MGKKDPKVDAYIAKSPEFARPILTHLRAVVHEACPGCEETFKWSRPHFMYKGMLAGMSAFKEHCVFGYWKGTLIEGTAKANGGPSEQLGHIRTLSDLPSKATLVKWTKQAAALNDEGVTATRKRSAPRKALPMPPVFAAALKKNRKAQAAFDAFAPSAQRDYIEWIIDAKSDDTRDRRLATAIEWIAEGKRRHWKYER